MNEIGSHSPTREQQSSSPPPTTGATILPLSNQPGMGLPFETWDHAIGFLKREPYPFLACSLTCRRFHSHAAGRLKRLFCPTISLHEYANIDNFVEDIRTICGRAHTIRGLALEGQPLLAFSLVPHRLAIQLVNLHELSIYHIPKAPIVPSSTWSLYGHAFPSVEILDVVDVQFPSFKNFIHFITSFRSLTKVFFRLISFVHPGALPRSPQFPSAIEINLKNVQFLSFEDFLCFVASFRVLKKLALFDISFVHTGVPRRFSQFPSSTEIIIRRVRFPSFEDFVHFITSFSALQKLGLDSVSCAHPGLLPNTLQSPRMLNPLKRLTLSSMNEEGHFLGPLIYWLSSRGCAIQEIDIDQSVLLHPLCYLLLRSIRTHLQEFFLSFGFLMEEFRKPSQRLLDVFSHEFPNLRKLKMSPLRDQGVEYARALIAHAVRPTLTLEIHSYAPEDATINIWYLFDTMFFALRVCHKSQVRVEYTGYEKQKFPLMFLFG